MKRDATLARARRDACRASMFDGYVEAGLYVRRSLLQMIRSGQRFAMVPHQIASPEFVAALISGMGDAPLICGAILDDRPRAVSWACLARYAPLECSTGHAWPDTAARTESALAILEQTDPVARIERRVEFALAELDGPPADPLLADMPTA